MSEHHYIIRYDSALDRWDLDTDNEDIRFSEGTIYDTDTDEWLSEYLGEGKYHPLADQLSKQIVAALDYLNKGVANARDN
jgi:hypothetical protein